MSARDAVDALRCEPIHADTMLRQHALIERDAHADARAADVHRDDRVPRRSAGSEGGCPRHPDQRARWHRRGDSHEALRPWHRRDRSEAIHLEEEDLLPDPRFRECIVGVGESVEFLCSGEMGVDKSVQTLSAPRSRLSNRSLRGETAVVRLPDILEHLEPLARLLLQALSHGRLVLPLELEMHLGVLRFPPFVGRPRPKVVLHALREEAVHRKISHTSHLLRQGLHTRYVSQSRLLQHCQRIGDFLKLRDGRALQFIR
mmetsp:Transcript_71789/g.199206  ORF Transcript_71789/g.199206 Transcript_71789/m.199206 type:complete len:259 (+) Transcript_71789:1261-2037(+)